MANSGLPYPIRVTGDTIGEVELPGVPLGSFYGIGYDEASYPIAAGDVYVFCSDGVSEAMNAKSEEFTSARLKAVVWESRSRGAREIAQAISAAVDEHRAGAPPNDDMTIVVVKT
jgi:sigma-B regulation protein RsbU (phosphoserine phosphatase)